MKLKDASEALQNHLALRGQKVELLRPEAGIEAMIAFYRDTRFDDCVLENDGDMLLFQWGTNDWGQGEWFELNITRQLIENGGEDDDIWQLSLTWKYRPSEAVQSLVSGNQWCSNSQEIADFEAFIHQSMAFDALSQSQAESVELNYFKTG